MYDCKIEPKGSRKEPARRKFQIKDMGLKKSADINTKKKKTMILNINGGTCPPNKIIRPRQRQEEILRKSNPGREPADFGEKYYNQLCKCCQ
jgi:hypothetical protein